MPKKNAAAVHRPFGSRELVAAVAAELVDVGGQGLGNPQPGQQQQAGEGVVASSGRLGGVEEPDGLGPGQAEGGQGVVGRGPADVDERVDRHRLSAIA